MNRSTRCFPSPTHLAEVATAGVQYNLAVGDRFAAAALQPVAAAAWEWVADPSARSQLEKAVRDAEAALAMACGVSGERQFLRDVVMHLRPGSDERGNRSGVACRKCGAPVPRARG